jgi:hypothetical protein
LAPPFSFGDRAVATLNTHAQRRRVSLGKAGNTQGVSVSRLAQRYFESAAQEAVRPTNIPEGTLKQITKYDATGRPFYEFAGSPRVWLDQFSAPKKYLAGIMDNRHFQKI